MRVLHVFKTYLPDTHGGVEQVIFQLAEGGVRHGVASQVFALSAAGTVRNQPFHHHLVHRARQDLYIASTGFSLSAIVEFRRALRGVDLIHYHFPWPYMDVLHLLSGTRLPTVLTYHSDIVKQRHLMRLYRPLMHRFLSRMDCIVASSPGYAESSPVLAALRDKVSVVPFGLDRTTYPTPDVERLASWRARVGEQFFLFVGALRYYKGLDYLLAAVEGTDLPLVICGGGDPQVEARLRQAAEANPRLHFLGAQPDEDKVALLTLCRAMVLPSHLRSEAFGVSLLEAAMLARPIVCCEIGTGTTFINRDGVTGLVVPPGDAGALRAAMQRLQAEPALAQRMGVAAQERFETCFSAERMVDGYLALYRRLLRRD
ncbi:glycosyltransferase [Verticiella sediminum]|uniref:Glycosyltransferase n=1 Tax=Verticiella sediminum TaxID=1247510 RepID=A0A556ABK5_9BURK|nr:glycosyltransferase [Verticiella sediminum]TSH90279.1 glycosyltransferase [Verticiella sediminum]